MGITAMYGFDDSAGETGVTGTALGFSFPGRNGYGGALLLPAGGATVANPESSSPVANFGFAINPSQATPATLTSLYVYAEDASHIQGILKMNGNGVWTFTSFNGAVRSTCPIIIPSGWNYVEVYYLVGPANVGRFSLWLNGKLIWTYIGVTQYSTAYLWAPTLSFISTNAQSLLDDMYFASGGDSAFPYGDCQVRLLLPTANGDSSQWTNSAGNQINNYSYVDENPSSSTDYVSASGVGLADLYQQQGGIPVNYKPLATQGLVYAAKTDTGVAPNVAFYSKGGNGGVRTDPIDTALSTAYQGLSAPVETSDPDGNPLTIGRVSAMQIGVQSS